MSDERGVVFNLPEGEVAPTGNARAAKDRALSHALTNVEHGVITEEEAEEAIFGILDENHEGAISKAAFHKVLYLR